MHSTETGGWLETMISKDMLQCLLPVELKNTVINKSFSAGRVLVSRWIKFHQLSYFLREPDDDNEIIEMSR